MNPSDLTALLPALVAYLSTHAMDLVFAAIPGSVAAKRGWPFWWGFLAGIFLHWVPAMILFSILPPRRITPRQEEHRDRSIQRMAQERARIEEAERRATARPLAPQAAAGGGRKAAAPAEAQAAPRPAPLPPPPVQDLPADLHPDPLAGAPRATLRAGAEGEAGHSGQG